MAASACSASCVSTSAVRSVQNDRRHDISKDPLRELSMLIAHPGANANALLNRAVKAAVYLGCGFHSRDRFWASLNSAPLIVFASASRACAEARSPAAARLNHL